MNRGGGFKQLLGLLCVLRMLLLKEDGNKLRCTLWENFAVEMCSVIDKSFNESVIFVIQFAKMKSWRGVMGICNTMFNIRIFINNYDILEVLAFKERFDCEDL
ncbi:hypothetical protein SLEP1_g28459 [Rubroshorea leprosula]|uniref:Uncharacterized protein n=1 Tax=Rubroshorea leprosula TaxID=152421 RepID=A0AAV5K341_9ROSI|nr:hypothetical protein SLEP1_g28459 [Rubroshorea leprosula]